MAALTIIGHCTQIAQKLEDEAKLWRAMEQAMGYAYEKLKSEEERAAVHTLLERIPTLDGGSNV